jgi:battenin
MIPMPGTPGFSWQRLSARVQGKFEGADLKVCIAFWLFGNFQNTPKTFYNKS